MDQNEVKEKSDPYDYDAPNQVVDLAELYNAPTDDSWFEKHTRRLLTPSLQMDETTEAPQEHADNDPGSTSPPLNIVTSWDTDAKPTMTSNHPQRVSKRKKETSGPPLKRPKKSPVADLLRKSRRILKSVRTSPSASSIHTAPSAEPTSEELELERMRDLQEEVALHRKKNEASYKAALVVNPPPKKMATTVPKEFSFKTDARIKTISGSNITVKEVNFQQQLRKPSSPGKALKKPTVPKPFNLTTSRKRKVEEPASYVPMAQQIEQFHRRTPERFHQPSRQTHEKGPSPVKSTYHKPTVKVPTIPETFQLQIEKRLQERLAKKPQVVVEEEEPTHTFKSHPVSKKILEGVVGVPEKKTVTLTVPESPAFALKKRVRVEPSLVEVKQPSPVKAPPVPHFGLPFQPKLPENHHVEVCPFSFDKREQEKRVLKEKKMEQIRNEEVPKFKAQPLPDFTTVVLPEKKKLEPTKPEPFSLLIDARGAERSSRWEQMVQEEKKQKKEATHFKAKPNVVIHKEPFKPKKEERSDTSTSTAAFQLLTERRAQERQEFDQLVSEKEALRALMEEQQRKEEAEREKEEIAKLRQEQVHKAQPIKHYRCVKVKKSEIPLTVPQSPNFSDRFRM